jgi:serine/alanine adding enzyme
MSVSLAVGTGSAALLVTREICDPRAWDAFVHGSPEASYTHLAAWHRVMSGALGHEVVQLVARSRDGEVAGVLPLVWVRSALTGRYLVSMPFLNSGGPIGTDDARIALSQAAAIEARRGCADLLELRTRQACDALSLSSRKITVTLPLPASPDALWQTFPSKLRSQIKRPRSAGLTVQFGAQESAAFYAVYARHMRDLGSPGLGRSVFEAIASALPDHVEFAIINDRAGRTVAAGCGFLWRGTFELVWAAALRDASADAPNMLLYWSLMERSIVRGAAWFDFGRCTQDSGTHRFKRQWGGTDVPLPWMQWSARGVIAPPTTDRPIFRTASNVWRRLPPVVTRAVGPALARLLP